MPIAAYAEIEGETLHLRGHVTAHDGSEQIDVVLSSCAQLSSARELGKQLAEFALKKGVGRLLDKVH